jgi:hypothetical protein
MESTKKTFKIALYLAGHMRSFGDYVYKNIQQLIEGYDVDIYISTYDYEDRSECEFEGSKTKITLQEIIKKTSGLPVVKIKYCKDGVGISCVSCRTNEAKYTNVMNSYIPTHCFMCKTNDMHLFDDRSCISMWKNIWICHSMAKEYEKEKGFEYKYYIRSRPDLVCLEKVHFERLPDLSRNIIIGFGGTLGYPDDQFCITEKEPMDHYCDIHKVLQHSLKPHEVVKYTLNVFPLCGHVNTGLVRKRYWPQSNKILHEVESGKWLGYYDRKTFGISGIKYMDARD